MTANTDDPVFNFIHLIENRPCLWNYNLPEYSKRNKTEKAWSEVAEEMKDSVSNCRERWRNIRGAFTRSLKKPPSGSAANTSKKYYLADYLQFIIPFTKSRSSTGNLKKLLQSTEAFETENSESQESSLQSSHTEVIDKVSQDDDSQLSDTISTRETYKSSKKHKMNYNSSADDAFVDWIKSNKQHEADDPNMTFFRSLLQDINKMTDKQIRRFRQKVIGLIDEILEDTDITSQSNVSWSTRSSVGQASVDYPTANTFTLVHGWQAEVQTAEMSSAPSQDQNNGGGDDQNNTSAQKFVNL